MMKNNQFKNIISAKAFVHAFNGYRLFFSRDRNGKIHLAVTVAVVTAGFAFHIVVTEWVAILFCIGLVLSLEMINAAIEQLCNIVQSKYHPLIKLIKDVSAAAVLWAAMLSAIIGAVIFLPKIFK